MVNESRLTIAIAQIVTCHTSSYNALSELACWQIGLLTGVRNPLCRRLSSAIAFVRNVKIRTATSRTRSLQKYAALCRDSVWRPVQIETLVKSLCVVRRSRRSVADSDETWQFDFQPPPPPSLLLLKALLKTCIRTDGAGEGRAPDGSDVQNINRKRNKLLADGDFLLIDTTQDTECDKKKSGG